ncbi:MAG: DUF2007 domain-containing protein [Clostridia bacterium]
MSEILLATVLDSVELFLYEGILKQNEIPYIVRQTGIRGYMKILGGASHSVPADIFVAEEDHDKAVECTEVIRTEENKAPDNKNNPEYRKKMIIAWIITGIFGLAILAAFLYGALK